MAKTTTQSASNQKKLQDYRAYQEELLSLSQQYGQARLAVWAQEAQALHDSWSGLSQDWQSNLDQMTAASGNQFAEMAAQGEAAANLMSQSWQQNLTAVSGSVDQWGENFLNTLAKVAGAWGTTAGSQGGGGGSALSLLGGVLDFGGIFHDGGIVEAHQGMVISPGTLMADEQLILAQKGEGVLPRESMARLGEKNFEALRTGQFDLNGSKNAPGFNVTIQVQALDASGVAGLNWDRVVQRHLLPALRQEADRRW
jgi:lambda family phage tail tape measure protein